MPDYKEMYLLLFRASTKAIVLLQQAQQQAEERYLSEDTANGFIVIQPDPKTKNKQPSQD